MFSLLLSIFLLQLGHAAAGSWDDTSLNGTATAKNETATSTASSTASLTPQASHTPPHQFQVGITRSGRRYQTGKHYWAFSGDDGVVTDDAKDAAWFYYEVGYLKSEDKYVNVDGSSDYSMLELSSEAPGDQHSISTGKDGKLGLHGEEYTIGKGHGVFCASDDGNVFVIASKKPPFRCYQINLRSTEPASPPHGQHGHYSGTEGSSGSDTKHTLIKPVSGYPVSDSHSSPHDADHPSKPNLPSSPDTHELHPTPTHSSPSSDDDDDETEWTDDEPSPIRTQPKVARGKKPSQPDPSSDPDPWGGDDDDDDDKGSHPPPPDPSSDPDPWDEDSSKLLDLPGKLINGLVGS